MNNILTYLARNSMRTKILATILLTAIGLSIFQTGIAKNRKNLKQSNKEVIEIVTFSTKSSSTPKDVINKAGAIMTTLRSYPGFLSRTLAESTKEKNEWVDIVRWRSLHDATTAANKIIKKSSMKSFISLMKSYKMHHFFVRFQAAK